MGRLLGEIEWEQRARTKVALVLPQGHAAEAPHDYVVVNFVPGVPDGHILEQMTVRPMNVVFFRTSPPGHNGSCSTPDRPSYMEYFKGEKCTAISSIPPVALTSAISLLRPLPFGDYMYVLK